jgi:prefoldin alpha subunit
MSEEEIRKVYSETQALQTFLDELRSRYQIILSTISDMETVKTAITELSKTASGEEILVDLGGGVLSRMSTTDNSKVYVNLGAGVLVEKKSEEAFQIIDTRVAALTKSREATEENIKRIEGEIGIRRTRLSELSKSITSQK